MQSRFKHIQKSTMSGIENNMDPHIDHCHRNKGRPILPFKENLKRKMALRCNIDHNMWFQAAQDQPTCHANSDWNAIVNRQAADDDDDDDDDADDGDGDDGDDDDDDDDVYCAAIIFEM